MPAAPRLARLVSREERVVSGSRMKAGGGPIAYGMVGGGQRAFIGAVHRIAARMDGEFELVAGALSSEPERARASAADTTCPACIAGAYLRFAVPPMLGAMAVIEAEEKINRIRPNEKSNVLLR